MANYLRYANQGATRNQPLDPRLIQALAFLEPMGITAEVFSGGQPGKGSGLARVGSVRHDHGNAGDMRFYKGGKPISWANPQDLPIFEDIVRQGKKAGITGFGAGPGYMGEGTMHVGFGSPGVWGAGGRGANAPEWLRNAFSGGGGTNTAIGGPGKDPITDPYASMPDGPKGQEVYRPADEIIGSPQPSASGILSGGLPQPTAEEVANFWAKGGKEKGGILTAIAAGVANMKKAPQPRGSKFGGDARQGADQLLKALTSPTVAGILSARRLGRKPS